MASNKREAQWGKDMPAKVLYPAPAVRPTAEQVEAQLDRVAAQMAVEGAQQVHAMPGARLFVISHAASNNAKRAGVGFILGGFLGAAIGAATGYDARTERLSVYTDQGGAIYVKAV